MIGEGGLWAAKKGFSKIPLVPPIASTITHVRTIMFHPEIRPAEPMQRNNFATTAILDRLRCAHHFPDFRSPICRRSTARTRTRRRRRHRRLSVKQGRRVHGLVPGRGASVDNVPALPLRPRPRGAGVRVSARLFTQESLSREAGTLVCRRSSRTFGGRWGTGERRVCVCSTSFPDVACPTAVVNLFDHSIDCHTHPSLSRRSSLGVTSASQPQK